MLTRTDEPLSRWTTLRLGGPAAHFTEAESRAELFETTAACDSVGQPLLVLGGGSNLVIPDDGFAGTVMRVASRGVRVMSNGTGLVRLDVEAGESWDDLVARSVAEGWSGIEALSGIPGTVGATPIQNVGAYGQEVSDSIRVVEVFDRVDRVVRSIVQPECRFEYRSSWFKQVPDRFVIGTVILLLPTDQFGPEVRYSELARRLGVGIGERAPSADVRDAVLELRRSKGMVLDEADRDTWSAGSFFTNPFVEQSLLPPGAPAYPAPDGLVKTSAAWLVEHAGLAKGYGNDRVSLSTKHTLALTNRGGATTADLLSLAREVRTRVEVAFGIRLEPEPTLVDSHL